MVSEHSDDENTSTEARIQTLQTARRAKPQMPGVP